MAQKEIFWSIRFNTTKIEFPAMILTMNSDNNKWPNTQIAKFSGLYSDLAGCFSLDSKKFFFSSDRPVETTGEQTSGLDLWYVKKSNSIWSKPIRLSSLINTDKLELNPTVAANGNLYYVGHFEEAEGNFGIFRSKFQDGEYLKPEPLGKNINSNEFQWTPFIAPDESYLLFAGTRSDGYGFGDIYISVKSEDDTFGKPINLGDKINTKYNERFPYVSPDNKYLFFTSNKVEVSHDKTNPLDYNQIKKITGGPGNGHSDIYWVDIEILKNHIIK